MRRATEQEIKTTKEEIITRHREFWFASWAESNSGFLLDFFDNKKHGIPELTGKRNLKKDFERYCTTMVEDYITTELLHKGLTFF